MANVDVYTLFVVQVSKAVRDYQVYVYTHYVVQVSLPICERALFERKRSLLG